ncbi:putative cyclin-B3-1 isoform X1 [Rosa chinensis]|uniref:putative cyclin-B3-1 isoform X1 n=1 Tax=Rosa chinensis TaxID=74649 RepID=UPI000D08F15E|nr:putative cyclin-B3-1 isoform X1 [Rosa chinensis]
MASFKRRSSATKDTNKLGAFKSNVSMVLNRLGKENQTHTVGAKNLKVYTEKGTAKPDVDSRSSVPLKKPAILDNKSVVKAGLFSMEKSKATLGSVATGNVGRRALADVSNVKGNSSRVVGGDASKPMVGKTERKKSLQRPSVGTGTRNVNVTSRRSLLGKERESSQGVSVLQTTKRVVGIKDLKAPSENQKTKAMGLSNESRAADSRRTLRNSLKLTRLSLPEVKVNQEEASISKENAGSPGKAKVGKKLVSRVSNDIRSYVSRNRVSDGFLIRGQKNSNVRVMPRKSTKSTLKVPKSGGMQPKYTSGPNKLASVTATKSKTQKAVEFVIAEDVKQETTQGEVPSDGNCSKTASDIISRRNSSRRRSYTSLLMTGSKLLEERVEAMKEELPSIDNHCNQLEVSDYVDEIYQYYWIYEAQNPPRANFLLIQADITPHMRGILVNWLIEVHFKFDLMQETLYLMVTLLDQYLSQVPIKKNEMQLVGLTALLLASKYEDFWHPRVKELISISAESYTRDQVLEMERLILKKLKFRLNTPTPYVFMLRFLKAAQSDKKLEHLAFYLIELCLVEYEPIMVKPSLLCAAAIYVARCTLQITPAWTPLLCKHARYEVSQIRDCAEMILRFQKAAGVGKLKVTYEKYMRTDLSRVAAIEPLERLPL